jgi:hypothetical protein
MLPMLSPMNRAPLRVVISTLTLGAMAAMAEWSFMLELHGIIAAV